MQEMSEDNWINKSKSRKESELSHAFMTQENQKLLDGIRAAIAEDKREAFDELCKEIARVVEKIEASPPLTKNHYGKYLPFATTKMFAIVLILHGANKAGVIAAAKINGVNLD